ncbi:hypothetical protein EUA35_04740 [Bacillus subtilis]|nr:hypothetical protein [Bacillus subtilis]NOV07176.1 hypothetical protein [Bacillus sp. seq1]QAW07515.1 hypothetical protein ETA15_04875 [Bacillus subtilis]TWO99903.1 hypothetical protein EUA35_04740 [Bacillus subtilis]
MYFNHTGRKFFRLNNAFFHPLFNTFFQFFSPVKIKISENEKEDKIEKRQLGQGLHMKKTRKSAMFILPKSRSD